MMQFLLRNQAVALGSLALFLSVGCATPVPDKALQQLLRLPPATSAQVFGNAPFTPGHRDPYDHKVDSVGEDRQPLPYRNGDGATVMGPRNKDRERENPDLVRPPSTDHGSMSNMRWSFADSHTRIEVPLLPFLPNSPLTPMVGRWMDAADDHP